MLPRTISSLQHPFVKYCVKLRSNKSFRREEKKALIFGSKLINELSHFSPLKIVLETSLHSSGARAENHILVSDDIIKKISGMHSPEPVAAIIEMPQEIDLSQSDHLLILDQISDPGNLGTLLRTALALGWDGVFLLGDCCDPYNDKALRAAKGATFLLPLQSGDWTCLQKVVHAKKRECYVASLQGAAFKEIKYSDSIALALGSESHGPSKDLIESFNAIHIPMHGQMESLNVAAAGAILLQHMRGVS